jgi:hypothetical protein
MPSTDTIFDTAKLPYAQRIAWLKANDPNGEFDNLTGIESIVLIVLILTDSI